jgi:FkbM family methyltransferase
MLKNFITNFAVQLSGLVARSGVRRLRGIDRGFLALYAAYKRYFEAGPIDRLQEFVPSGSVVIDVGANVGFFSVLFARWVGDSGEVIAIEPENRNYDNLISTLKRKGLINRVRAIKAVAAAVPGKTFLKINQLHPADHQLSRDGTGVSVDAIKLDDLVPDKSALRPCLIKIDVQGAEMLVLQGASDILTISGSALFVELHEEGLSKFGTSVSAILDHLSLYGYESYWLMREGRPRKATSAEINASVLQSGYVDVLFLKKDVTATGAAKSSS